MWSFFKIPSFDNTPVGEKEWFWVQSKHDYFYSDTVQYIIEAPHLVELSLEAKELQKKFNAWCDQYRDSKNLDYLRMMDGEIYIKKLWGGELPLSHAHQLNGENLSKLVDVLLWNYFFDELTWKDEDELRLMDKYMIINSYYTLFLLEFTDLKEGLVKLSPTISYRVDSNGISVHLNQ